MRYRDSAELRSQPSPEEMQAILAMWGAWFKQFGPKILDGGDGLHPTGRVLKPGGEVANGPYVEAKEVIGGYSVIDAEHYEAAVEIPAWPNGTTQSGNRLVLCLWPRIRPTTHANLNAGSSSTSTLVGLCHRGRLLSAMQFQQRHQSLARRTPFGLQFVSKGVYRSTN